MPRLDPLVRLRRLCFALPECTEKEAWGTPTFRVRDKMFAMYVNDHHGDGRVAIWCKAPPGVQEIVVGADPKRFFVPPYVGHKGWIGVCLDGAVDWDEVADFLRDGYRLSAPKRLAALLEDPTS
jgi:predicted DNA-binding protein (MmcQ/YjbR family)